MIIEERLADMGLVLPEPMVAPAGVTVPIAWARRYGDRVYLSGHTPLHADGTIAGPFGRVGSKIKTAQAYDAARRCTLSMLASLKREIGDLDAVAAWLRIEGYVLTAPGFYQLSNVINGCSDLLGELFGPEIARHARSSIGVAATPFDCPVFLAAEVAITSGS
jgi:enamine deaminase RidA (YjgF/YER057c/UK114 family)